jgi:hypothetical protein
LKDDLFVTFIEAVDPMSLQPKQKDAAVLPTIGYEFTQARRSTTNGWSVSYLFTDISK